MLEDRRVKIFLLTLAITLTAGLGLKAFVGFKAAPAEVAGTAVTPGQAQAANPEIIVYVTGAVQKQGLVKLRSDARLDDALKAAGLANDADLNTLNLAEKLKDGEKIVVPKIGAIQAGNAQVAGGSTTQSSVSANRASGSSSGGKVNINTATAQELDSLPGIGPAMAERIIAYRTEKGTFTSPEDLKEVSGIGDKKYAQLADRITVN